MDMSAYPGQALSNWVPEFLAVQIPYIFKDVNVAFKALQGPLGDEIAEIVLKKTGIRILEYGVEGPYLDFMSAKKPIRVPADVKGVKFRVAPIPILTESAKAMGAASTVVTFAEQYSAMQQGVVDGTVTGLGWLRATKLDELVKYVGKANFFLAMSNFYVSEKFWQKLSEEDQRLCKSAAMSAMRVFNGMVHFGDTMWQDYLKKRNIEVYNPTDEEMKLWKDTVYDHMVEWVIKEIGNDEIVNKTIKASQEAEKALYGN
jgi:TRAP-type C4-dicarboxylate transport system substrate-binding protein